MKRLAVAAIVAAILIPSLAGCTVRSSGEIPQEGTSGTSSEENAPAREIQPYESASFVQELPDGSSVLCVWIVVSSGGGLSCDWANKTTNLER